MASHETKTTKEKAMKRNARVTADQYSDRVAPFRSEMNSYAIKPAIPTDTMANRVNGIHHFWQLPLLEDWAENRALCKMSLSSAALAGALAFAPPAMHSPGECCISHSHRLQQANFVRQHSPVAAGASYAALNSDTAIIPPGAALAGCIRCELRSTGANVALAFAVSLSSAALMLHAHRLQPANALQPVRTGGISRYKCCINRLQPVKMMPFAPIATGNALQPVRMQHSIVTLYKANAMRKR
eukprot:Gb_34785 [translate_table: standard]